jgi:hypothetical protein
MKKVFSYDRPERKWWIAALCRTVSWFELEHRPDEILYRYTCRIRRRFVVAGMSVGLHARIFPVEPLTGFGKDQIVGHPAPMFYPAG